LGDGEVHVWRASLDLDPYDLDNLRSTLSPDERPRADRFVLPQHRARFAAARGILRDILSRYLNCVPAAIDFHYGPSGKPALAPGSGRGEIRFNLSHSHGLALYSVAHSRGLGIDVESISSRVAEERIAERFFSPAEVAALRALPASARTAAFFRCWTCKEAYIKAKGGGLSIPLDSFDVSVTPGEPAALLGVRDDPLEAARWSLEELAPGGGYAAALAVEGTGWALRLWEWAPAPHHPYRSSFQGSPCM
jgi:4'-phosphopantetheinyl transferase